MRQQKDKTFLTGSLETKEQMVNYMEKKKVSMTP